MARAAGARKALHCAVACLLIGGLVAGCASTTNNDALKALNPDPPDKMYTRAEGLLNNGNYTDAAKKFEDLDRDHPYAPEARRAIVMAAYAYYKGGKYQEAIASAKRYTTLHPGTKDAALAHHIIASANFDEIRDPARDQTTTRRALAELKTLIQRYPDSPYSKQAANRIRLAEDLLAASEMSIGRYYQNRNNHVAAINRYKTVVTEYQTTQQVEEALYRLVEANMALGIAPEAQTAAAVLGHNYPNSEWYVHAHALLKSGGLSPQITQGTWLSKTIKAITPGSQKPEAKPVPPPSPGLPSPEDLPSPRIPSDVPVSSAPSKPPLGLAQSTQWQPEVRR
jgi:outer membrane protein assembly factor BamD